MCVVCVCVPVLLELILLTLRQPPLCGGPGLGAKYTTQQSLEENLLGGEPPSAIYSDLLHSCQGHNWQYRGAEIGLLSSWALLWWAVFALRHLHQSGRDFLEGHCSPKLLLLNPPSCLSPFPSGRPALWSEGSPYLLLYSLSLIFQCYPNKSLAHQIPSWDLLCRGL